MGILDFGFWIEERKKMRRSEGEKIRRLESRKLGMKFRTEF
ncbi:hypothetical protein D1AOALGA4SA_9207 [Olavius algarvensis Delta 1 endosymbiont]|nr:hypothetical protein D1AOALGA4SA_9207 [Olavius algarvensis Delta 1 endosymbiont]